MKRKINPLDISYLEQMRRFALGFMLASFLGDVTTSIKLLISLRIILRIMKSAWSENVR